MPGRVHCVDPVTLSAGRLHLRPWEPQDAAQVLAACQDPEIARWTTVPSPYTEQDARTYVEEVCPRGWADGTTASFAVLDAASGDVLASVALMGVGGGSAEVGFWTAPGARRQGVTAQAVGAVCRWGFGSLGLARVPWQAEVGNWGSRAVAESNGFRVEGTLRAGLPRRGGGRADAWAGSLLATDEVRDRRAFGGRWHDLEGGGLLLRPWRSDDPGDLAALVAGSSDPETARWTPVASPYGPEQGRAWLERTMPQQWADGAAASLAVQEDGRAVGLVVLIPASRDAAVAEVGWWTLPSARGRGVAARAVRVLQPWAARLGRVRLEAYVDVDNVASQRVAERAGMRREGVLAAARAARSGERRDMVLFALT